MAESENNETKSIESKNEETKELPSSTESDTQNGE